MIELVIFAMVCFLLLILIAGAVAPIVFLVFLFVMFIKGVFGDDELD